MGFAFRVKEILREIWHGFVFIISSITVEPALFLLCLGSIIGGITTTTILYEKICQSLYTGSSNVNCQQLSAHPAVQDRVQQESAKWNLAFDGVSTFISIPAILLWSSWADHKKDRIAAIMIPIVGIAIPLYAYLLEDRIAPMPLWILILAKGLGSGLGGLALLIGSLNAYLADRFENKKWLAIRFSMVIACVQLSAVLGSEVDGALTRFNIDTAWIIVIGLGLITLAQLYFAVGLTNPVDVERKKLAKMQKEAGNSVNNNDEKCGMAPQSPPLLAQRQKSIFVTTFDLLKDTYNTFSRPRPRNKRTYILLIIFASFLAGVSDDGTMSSQNLFLYRRPLNYTFQEYSQLTGGTSGMGLVGTVVATAVTKWFGWADTSLAMLSLVFNVAGNLIFAFSRTKIMVWMSSLVNCIGFLWASALNSTVIKLGDPGEQATLIAGTAVASSLANFVSSVMFNAVYTATEAERPWVAWVVASGLISVGMLCVLGVHVGLKLQGSSLDDADSRAVRDDSSSGESVKSSMEDSQKC